MSVIDLNADLGEGASAGPQNDDAAMLEVVTTANVASGGHAGDRDSMREAAHEARVRGVAITAHVSYPDVEGFGRRFVNMPFTQLVDTLIAQVSTLQQIVESEGVQVRGVKPHGALYNAIAHHEEHARAVVQLLREAGSSTGRAPLTLVAAPRSLVSDLARAEDIPVVLEAFADRGYRPDGTLVPRDEEGAVLTHEDAVVERVLRLVTERRVLAADGSWVELDARTVCLHGDTPGSVHLARAVRSRLDSEGIELRSALAEP